MHKGYQSRQYAFASSKSASRRAGLFFFTDLNAWLASRWLAQNQLI